ncbi:MULTISPECIES: nuclear transport factor 2 family protein [unclassified Sphingomonas]|uniref:nuclear transport factor 2 family protein n=1 Tax=Novosphingobium rhizosphaerae TaxID=1551649 RepID=UPI0015CA2FC7
MGSEASIQTVKAFFAAIGDGDRDGLLALVAEDSEWIIPGEGWPLAGTHRGHAGIANVQRMAAEELETTYPRPPEIIALADRVFVVGIATGKIKATGRSFNDEWVFDITVHDGKVTRIQEYIDTQALALASRKTNQA